MLDLTGQHFGELTALKRIPVDRNGKSISVWLCQCSCGNLTMVRLGNLRNGHTKSCGHCTHFADEGEYERCTLRGGRSFIFDREDLPLVQQYNWSMDRYGYVLGNLHGHRKSSTVRLHRLLMNAPDGMIVDHINGDPSDCRRENLRIATQQQNTQNAGLPSSSTTGYKGVCYDKKEGKYMAHIHPNGRMVFLGYFNDPIEAALKYDEAAFLYFGEYARPNFPSGSSDESIAV